MIRRCNSPGYNWIFNMENGAFARWGKDKEDDPQYSPLGPEIADIEVSTICSGGCDHCYKSNNDAGKNMPIELFEHIIDKLPKNITQVALGVGDYQKVPHLWDMMAYCRSKNIVPNITINGYYLTREDAYRFTDLCGAVAVSNYHLANTIRCVKMLKEAGLKQINIHQLLSHDLMGQAHDLLNYAENGWDDFYAIVFLGLKQKGRGKEKIPLKSYEFNWFVNKALKNNIPIGFDSCSAHKFLKCVESHPQYETFKTLAEPCESGCFSIYIDVDGFIWPCSFTEREIISKKQKNYYVINMYSVEDFMKDVWYSPKIVSFRKHLLKNGRVCPVFKV